MKTLISTLLVIGLLNATEVKMDDNNIGLGGNSLKSIVTKIKENEDEYSKTQKEIKNISDLMKRYHKFFKDKDILMNRFLKLNARCDKEEQNFIQQNSYNSEYAQKELYDCRKIVNDFIKNVKPQLLKEIDMAYKKIKNLKAKSLVDQHKLLRLNDENSALKALLQVKKDLGGLK